MSHLYTRQKRKHLYCTILSLCFCFGVDSQAGETLTSLEREIRTLIDSTKTSVVTVSAHFAGEQRREKESGILSFFKTESPQAPVSYINIGTGIIFNEQGHILTRSSIILGAEFIKVIFASQEEVTADFVGYDPETGFAVIKVAHSGLQPARLGNSDAVVPGAWNLMIGNSLGVYPSITFGTINGVREDGMLQISADLNPGNNGNPIFDVRGDVIGLIAGRLNVFDDGSLLNGYARTHTTILAYPINRIKRVAEDIIAYGYVRKGWLGVMGYYDSSTPKIGEIKHNSPAENAGLSEGDVIVKFSLRDVRSISDLARLVERATPGESVPLEYLRSGKRYQTVVKIGEKKRKPSASAEQQGSRTLTTPIPYPRHERNDFIVRRIEQIEHELQQLKKMVHSR